MAASRDIDSTGSDASEGEEGETKSQEDKAKSQESEAKSEEDKAEGAASQPETKAESTTKDDVHVDVDVPAATAPSVDSAGRSRRTLIGRALLAAVVVVAAWWTVAKALEIKGQLVEDTMLTPAAYLDQFVSVEVNGVEHRHTLAELGWTTEATDAIIGRLFARQRLHAPIEPPGGPTASPIVAVYRSELEREPTTPTINAQWNVAEGTPGVATTVAVDGSLPTDRIIISTDSVEPESSASLRRFAHQRSLHADGWEIKLLLDDGTLAASLDPQEVAAHIQLDRVSATVKLVDEAAFRDLLAERIRHLGGGGERGRFEFEASDDGVTPLINGGRFNVVDTLTEPIPGQVPDMNRAWNDLIDAVQSFGQVVTVQLVDADDLYSGIDPADLTVKLAESRTPNTGGSRMTNIRTVLDLTQGVVVEPGGVFGINQTVGRRTAENGFTTAGAIANGEHIMAFGGGISQTATMFHQAAYMAGLTFPEREGGGIGGGHGAFGHSEYFGRYDNYHAEGWGLDGHMDTGRLGRAVEQTVNWPNREAGFINTTPHPILVWTFDTGDQVGVSLWSLERTRFGVYEGTDSWRRGSCIDWIHHRTVYDTDNNVMFEDSYTGFYRTSGPTCAG